MRVTFRMLIAVLIITAAFASGRWAYAQAPQRLPPTTLPSPTIISGADVGFRVDPMWTERQGKVSGRWVVRINGEWVEPAGVPMPRSLSSR